MSDVNAAAHRLRPYDFFIAALSAFALLILALQAGALDDRTRDILATLDTFVCIVFFYDFADNLVRGTPRGWRYFVTWGWLDLLSSIPNVSLLRIGRAARVARIVRILRGVRATKAIASVFRQHRAQSTALVACLVAVVVVAFASIAVLHAESGVPGATILTPDDALWWSVTTIMTVGYGDRVPVTSEGRLVAIVLMAAGLGLFSTFSARLAALFVGDNDDEVKRLTDEVRDLRSVVLRQDAMRSGAAPGPDNPSAISGSFQGSHADDVLRHRTLGA